MDELVGGQARALVVRTGFGAEDTGEGTGSMEGADDAKGGAIAGRC